MLKHFMELLTQVKSGVREPIPGLHGVLKSDLEL